MQHLMPSQMSDNSSTKSISYSHRSSIFLTSCVESFLMAPTDSRETHPLPSFIQIISGKCSFTPTNSLQNLSLAGTSWSEILCQICCIFKLMCIWRSLRLIKGKKIPLYSYFRVVQSNTCQPQKFMSLCACVMISSNTNYTRLSQSKLWKILVISIWSPWHQKQIGLKK